MAMEVINSFYRTGASAVGCCDLNEIQVEDTNSCIFACVTGLKATVAVIGIIVTLFRTVIRCIYYIFPILRGLKPMEPDLPVDPVAVGVSPGQHFTRLAFEVDFRDHKLRSMLYPRALLSLRNADWNYLGRQEDRNELRNFFNELIHDRDPRGLSHANAQALKVRVLAILNTLNSMRTVNQIHFDEQMRTSFSRMMDGLRHCMNNINPTFQTILIDVQAANRGGSLAQRVEMALQSFRMKKLQGAVHNVLNRIKDHGQKTYYMGHEAASETYYLKNLYTTIGVPEPASVHDFNYEIMACTCFEEAVMEEFDRIYTPSTVIDEIHEIVGNVQNPAIPVAMFNDWVVKSGKMVTFQDGDKQVPELDNDGNMQVKTETGGLSPLLDRNNYPQKFLIRDYLIEIGILRRY